MEIFSFGGVECRKSKNLLERLARRPPQLSSFRLLAKSWVSFPFRRLEFLFAGYDRVHHRVHHHHHDLDVVEPIIWSIFKLFILLVLIRTASLLIITQGETNFLLPLAGRMSLVFIDGANLGRYDTEDSLHNGNNYRMPLFFPWRIVNAYRQIVTPRECGGMGWRCRVVLPRHTDHAFPDFLRIHTDSLDWIGLYLTLTSWKSPTGTSNWFHKG